MVLLTMMLPTLLIPLTGLAIDASIARLMQLRLQAAVDGAVLGAGRLLGTAAVPKTLAEEFLAANFRTDGTLGTWGAHDLISNVVYTPGITKRIDVTAQAQVPLLFMRIFGQSNATVAATGSATRTDSRVMVVIDRSGSMNTSDGAGNTVIEDAKSYAAGFVQKFTESADELGLVVYDGSAVVAYPNTNPNWDPTTTSTSTGGPNALFNDPSNTHNMVNQIGAIKANNGQTGTAEALWLAYIELQKTHLKDLAADGVDFRLNSIVLLTDGLPQSVTVYPNNPTLVGGVAVNNSIKATSTCANRITGANPNPTPMYGWIAVSRPFSSSSPLGLYLLASRDTTASHDAVWYVGINGAGYSVDTPVSTGCGGLRPVPGSLGGSSTDFSQIPPSDMWGNSMSGNAYKTASQFVDASGNTVTNPLSVATTYDAAQKTSGDMWALSFWNSVDSAANRIRADVNRPSRVPADANNMAIAIYVIGYSGNGGVDQGLLKRVANDKTSSAYDATQATGIYVPAGNKTALANAFNTIYTAILRLAK
jgi:hypothetical protein